MPFFFSVFSSLVFFAAPRRPTRQKPGGRLCGHMCVQQTKASAGALLPSWTTIPWWVVRARARVERAHARVVRAHTRVGDRVLGGDSSQVGEQLAPADQINCHPGGRLCGDKCVQQTKASAGASWPTAPWWVVRAYARVERAHARAGSRPGGSGSCPGGAGSHLT